MIKLSTLIDEASPTVRGSQGTSTGPIKAEWAWTRYVNFAKLKGNLNNLNTQLERKNDYRGWGHGFGIMTGYECVEHAFRKGMAMKNKELTFPDGSFIKVNRGQQEYYNYLSFLAGPKKREFDAYVGRPVTPVDPEK